MTAIAPPTHELDLFADEVLLDPYPLYAELRELGGVVHLPKNDVYALTRYDVIRTALGDPGTFSSRSIGFNPMVNEALQGTSLASDPPVHAQLRATRSSTRAAALASICVFSPRRARGERFSVSVARSWAWTGGSEASDVPCRASLTIGLKPMAEEENVAVSASASRMTS